MIYRYIVGFLILLCICLTVILTTMLMHLSVPSLVSLICYWAFLVGGVLTVLYGFCIPA